MKHPEELFVSLAPQGFSLYSVSDQGRVMNVNREQMLSPSINKRGLPYVHLYDGSGGGKNRTVSTLVAKSFLDPPYLDHYDTVIHKNGDREDCRAENLAWRPRWFAIEYHQQFDRKAHLYFERRVLEATTNTIYDTITEAAAAHGVLRRDVKYTIESGNGFVPLGRGAIFEAV